MGASSSWSARGPSRSLSAHISRTGANKDRVDVPPCMKESPGPGHYTGQEVVKSGSSPKQKRDLSVGPKRKLVPPASALEKRTENAQLKAGVDMLTEQKPHSAAPGPGDYDPQWDAARGPTCFSKTGFSSF